MIPEPVAEDFRWEQTLPDIYIWTECELAKAIRLLHHYRQQCESLTRERDELKERLSEWEGDFPETTVDPVTGIGSTPAPQRVVDEIRRIMEKAGLI